jgi:hypothetical protein
VRRNRGALLRAWVARASSASSALTLYEEAASRWHEFGCVPGRAEALLGRGLCQISLGRMGAEEPLTQARNLFASMGHRDGLAESEALLA